MSIITSEIRAPISVTATTDYELIKNIITNPTLFKASMNMLGEAEPENWIPCKSATWVEFKAGDTLIGVSRFEPLTNVSICAHFYILPKFWGSGISDVLDQHFEEYVIKHTNALKIICMTPCLCLEVLKALKRFGFRLEGILTKAVIWDDKLVDLFLLGKMLKRSIK